ncbi:MAG: TolC family protein, partial [Alphaproteobacteria bacterium]|nr:TolC family protein [Alphaproteobacteria bacterium]
MNRLLPFALAALSWTPATAQEVPLQAVIAAALDHGAKVARADLKIASAQGVAQQAAGAFDWHANARAGWSRLYYPRVQSVGGTQVLTNDLQDSWSAQVSAGASKLFRNGIQIQPGITFYPGSSASAAQTFGLTRPVPNMNIQIPLLHGLDGTNMAAANERASVQEVGAAQLERTAAQQQAAMEAAQSYWRALAAAEEENLLMTELANSLSFLDAQRKLMAAGQITPLALEQAVIARANRQKQLDAIRREGAEARASLTALLQRDDEIPLPTLARAFPDMDESSIATLREPPLVESALRDRPDLRALEDYVAAASERLIAARHERDPKVNLVLDPNGFFVNLTYSFEGNTEKGGESAAAARMADASLNLAELKEQIRRDVALGVAALRASVAALAERRHSQQMLA